jgi:hypothetical protein
MQFIMTAIAVIAGLTFSFAIAILVEELIFGKVLRIFFAQPAAVKVSRELKR